MKLTIFFLQNLTYLAFGTLPNTPVSGLNIIKHVRTAVVHHNSFEENIAKINILFCSEHIYELLT